MIQDDVLGDDDDEDDDDDVSPAAVQQAAIQEDAPAAADTDAFATGIFVMGPVKGLTTLERLGMDGVIVDATGQVLMTKGIREKVHLVDGTP